LRSLVTEALPGYPRELDSLKNLIGPERLRSENSRYITAQAGRFWRLLLETSVAAAGLAGKRLVVILENLHLAGAAECQAAARPGPSGALLLATCASPEVPEAWRGLFPAAAVCAGRKPARLAGFRLGRGLVEIAACCARLGRFFPATLFVTLLAENGVQEEIASMAIGILAARGVFRSLDDPTPDIAHFDEDAAAILGPREGLVRRAVTGILLDSVTRGRIKPCFQLIKALHGSDGAIGDSLALDAVRTDVRDGVCACIDRAVAAGRFFPVCESAHPGRAASLLALYRRLRALARGDETEIRAVFEEPDEAEVWPAYRAAYRATEALYKTGVHDRDGAMEAAKDALLAGQEGRGANCAAQTYRLLALVHFSGGRINDALDYLAFAIDTAEREGDDSELTLAAYYAAETQFAWGNCSRALRLIEQAEAAAARAGSGGWAGRAAFARGRCLFGIGRYGEAAEVFSGLLTGNGAGGEADEARRATLAAWLYRAQVYIPLGAPPEDSLILNHEPHEQHEQTQQNQSEGSCGSWLNQGALCGDMRLFEIEAAYLGRDWERAAALADALIENPPPEGFVFVERPDWSSGFAQCELLQTSCADFYGRMAVFWRAAAIAAQDRRRTAEAVRVMQQALRDDRFADTAPNDVLQYYLYYHVLRESGQGSVDRNTAISIAFKRLQRRASRIDDLDIKRSFLSRQYWNRALFQAAKEHKLI